MPRCQSLRSLPLGRLTYAKALKNIFVMNVTFTSLREILAVGSTMREILVASLAAVQPDADQAVLNYHAECCLNTR